MKNKKLKKIILVGVVVAILVVGGFFARKLFFGEDAVFDFLKPSEFEQQFDIVLKDYNGNDVSLLDFKDEPLVIYSWASWCSFCENELINFVELQKEFNGVSVIAINRAEPLVVAKEYSDKLGSTGDLVFLLDAMDTFYKSIGGFSMPETIFVNKDGRVVEHKRGPMTPPEIKEITQKILTNLEQPAFFSREAKPIQQDSQLGKQKESIGSADGFYPQSAFSVVKVAFFVLVFRALIE